MFTELPDSSWAISISGMSGSCASVLVQPVGRKPMRSYSFSGSGVLVGDVEGDPAETALARLRQRRLHQGLADTLPARMARHPHRDQAGLVRRLLLEAEHRDRAEGRLPRPASQVRASPLTRSSQTLSVNAASLA